MTLNRREVVRELLRDRGDLLVISGLGAPTYDVAAAGDSPLNFYLWGAMGGAAMIGLGLALAKPDARVAVITGDGEMLMGLGALATIGVKQPGNLSVVIIDNRHYGETGMQASHTAAGIDLAAIAKACRFNEVHALRKPADIDAAHRLLHEGQGPVFIQAHVDSEEAPRVLPMRDGHEIKFRFMQALAQKEVILKMDVEKAKSALTVDQVTQWWETEITDIAPGVIRIRGYAIEDLIGRIGFADMIWLTLRGELPTKAEARLFEALLVSAVDHGPQAPSIAIGRMAATCGVGINSAMASAINALGDVHGGAGQQCMELLAIIHRDQAAGKALDMSVKQAVETFRTQHGAFVPGFGHRFHAVDPRAKRLFELLREEVRNGAISGRYLAIGEVLEDELGKGKSRPPRMNVDGVIAVVLSELGFPPELGRGIFILSRSVGICAHAYEQSQQGERLKGPMPPEAGFRYSGPAPRVLPDEVKTR